MPLLFVAVLKHPQPDQVLLRLLSIVEAVLRRTAYLVLLIENPGALKHLGLPLRRQPMDHRADRPPSGAAG